MEPVKVAPFTNDTREYYVPRCPQSAGSAHGSVSAFQRAIARVDPACTGPGPAASPIPIVNSSALIPSRRERGVRDVSRANRGRTVGVRVTAQNQLQAGDLATFG